MTTEIRANHPATIDEAVVYLLENPDVVAIDDKPGGSMRGRVRSMKFDRYDPRGGRIVMLNGTGIEVWMGIDLASPIAFDARGFSFSGHGGRIRIDYANPGDSAR